MMTVLRSGMLAFAVFALAATAPVGYALADGGGHVKETIKHLEESVKTSNDPHAKEALEHAKEAVKHAEESLTHAEQASQSKGKGQVTRSLSQGEGQRHSAFSSESVPGVLPLA